MKKCQGFWCNLVPNPQWQRKSHQQVPGGENPADNRTAKRVPDVKSPKRLSGASGVTNLPDTTRKKQPDIKCKNTPDIRSTKKLRLILSAKGSRFKIACLNEQTTLCRQQAVFIGVGRHFVYAGKSIFR